jgi:hypothetical protein
MLLDYCSAWEVIVLFQDGQCQFANFGVQRFDIDGRTRWLRLRVIAEHTRRPSRSWSFHCLIWLACTSNCWDNSTSVCSPRMAASATFALKAGLWFRRGRLVMVSPVPGI